MARKPLCVAILWHMHQPDYGNEESGEIYLPWTRFHAVKDYYDMGALIEQVPGLRLTINVVPSLIDQLEAYAGGTARETYAELTLRDAGTLDEREKAFLLAGFFQLPWRQMILPYPRYKELLDRRGTPDERGIYSDGLRRYSTGDYRDAQVWFNLSWCGNELRRDPVIADMIRKGRDFTEEEKRRLLERQTAFIGRILALYRRLQEDGGIEVSVSPYYHPILPLLCDNRAAREATPEVPLPGNMFSFPGDARMQIARAQDRFREVFGRDPRGMWPSEGSISVAACRLAGDAGLRWLASDEGVLRNSLRTRGHGDADLSPAQRYRAWRWADGPALFFRDQALSDLIGFTYSRWNEETAVVDFTQRLRRIYDALPDDGRDYVVPIILDGENAWEHYQNNGVGFLLLLYRSLVHSGFLQTVTFSEYLEMKPGLETLENITAGSWIYGSLTTWIGHPEKNEAWEALSATRQAFARSDPGAVDARKRERAFRELMIAEGSDWFWWYGDDHQTQNAVEFDALFRSHLKNTYSLLGQASPITLDIPIKKAAVRTRHRNPVHTLTPSLDGRVTDYFEWISAGFVSPEGGGAMHQAVRRLEKVFFGYDASRFYLRLDFAGQGLRGLPAQVSVQLQFVSPGQSFLAIDCAEGQWRCGAWEPAAPAPAAAGDRILEVGIPLEALGVGAPDEVRFFITLLDKERELERFPSTGFLVVPVDPWSLDHEEWIV
ncbi:MAG: glycoside hydrolase, family 57 [Acidobacteria bacterium]|nr:glycoside hydrolase, family 57 [Acidobacteriota bacterium]